MTEDRKRAPESDGDASTRVSPSAVESPERVAGEAPAETDPDFNLEVALYRVGDDPHVLRAIAELLVDEWPGRLKSIVDAVTEGDAAALERSAHSIRGTAATLALPAVRDVAGRLEEAGNVEALEHTATLVTQLEEALSRASDALKEQVLGG